MDEDHQQSPQPSKKRKLKHPRTSNACLFCRKRKQRCSGTRPSCQLCLDNEVSCIYSSEHLSRRQSPLSKVPSTTLASAFPSLEAPNPHSRDGSLAPSRQTSTEPGEVSIDNGVHIGPSSGVSFLYKWQEGAANVPHDGDAAAPLSSYGDMPLSRVSKAASPGLDEAHKLMDHYFRFAMPTFRFFHRQSLERWMADYVHRQPLPAAKAASVLIVWAQALISYPDDSIGDLQASQRGASYFEQARTLLNSELGPMTLACVEARLAMCLYLLCVSRIVECRFLFSFTHALAISMGLHRKASRRLKLAAFQQERRKRVFWSLYIVDSYLSVMLGQPRHLRDDDLDQEYPVNIDDLVLDAATDLSQVPHHGNIEAFIYHARLARLFTRSTDVLYPIHDISSEDIVQRGESIVAALDGLEQELPTFLKPRLTAAIGVQTWERQNSVLSLGFAHARIIATRRSLLVDTFKISSDTEMHQRHESCMRDCLDAIINVLDHVFSMLQHGRLLSTFWLTQYIALCAISTLFVYQIQQNQGKVPVLAQSRDLTQYLSKAQEIQEHLAKIIPQGSQAQRHHYLLSKLRQRASRSASSSVTPVEGRAQQSSRVQEEEERYPPSPQPQTQPPVDMPGGNDFTAVNMFDHDIPDAASWLYLDQLGMQPDFHATWPRY